MEKYEKLSVITKFPPYLFYCFWYVHATDIYARRQSPLAVLEGGVDYVSFQKSKNMFSCVSGFSSKNVGIIIL